ncbi:MAG: Crp/Fnr family transcriptional regulator [Oscillospiraceae bacterium]|nr:Crp/Fnr family transcriptional regulator [Oscillospiraceae bacterium]
MNREEKIAQIKPFFDFWDKLDETMQNFVCDNMYEMTYDAGENIHNGDVACIGVLFVQQGMLRVYIMSEEGKEVTLYRLEDGDTCVLSASCVLSEVTFDVHVDSESATKVWVLPAGAFSDLIERNIYFENYQNKLKAQRLSDVMWTMQQILFFSFDKRLAIFLYDELVKNGPVITYSHLEIAKYLGSAREVVSRMLKYFEKEGILTVSRKEIVITDKKRLFDYTK